MKIPLLCVAILFSVSPAFGTNAAVSTKICSVVAHYAGNVGTGYRQVGTVTTKSCPTLPNAHQSGICCSNGITSTAKVTNCLGFFAVGKKPVWPGVVYLAYQTSERNCRVECQRSLCGS